MPPFVEPLSSKKEHVPIRLKHPIDMRHRRLSASFAWRIGASPSSFGPRGNRIPPFVGAARYLDFYQSIGKVNYPILTPRLRPYRHFDRTLPGPRPVQTALACCGCYAMIIAMLPTGCRSSKKARHACCVVNKAPRQNTTR
jgi:hypothetical protein